MAMDFKVIQKHYSSYHHEIYSHKSNLTMAIDILYIEIKSVSK